MEIELPDDIRDWPSEPYELLGVDKKADTRTLRRAYIRLIRKYKPDREPEKFQLIHEAHERAQQMLEWRESMGNHDAGEEAAQDFTSVSRPMDDDDLGAEAGNDTNDETLKSARRTSSSPADPFDQFHDTLEQNRLADALAIIEQVDTSKGPRVVGRANLTAYYISHLFPPGSRGAGDEQADALVESDPPVSQQRFDWLMRAVADPGLRFPALERLNLEVDLDPTLATSASFDQFLASCDDAELLSAVYRLRWQSLGPKNFQTILADFQQLRPRSLLFGDHWEILIADSMEYTVWNNDPACRDHNQGCWDEISQNHDGHLADSVETLILAAEEWNRMEVGHDWASLIPDARNQLPSMLKRQWLPAARSIASDLRASLAELGRMQQNGPLAMGIFQQGLERLSGILCPSRSDIDWDDARELVACFFAGSTSVDYLLVRREIAEFCIENRIDLLKFGYLADSLQSETAVVAWSETLCRDTPLNCLFHAGRITDT